SESVSFSPPNSTRNASLGPCKASYSKRLRQHDQSHNDSVLAEFGGEKGRLLLFSLHEAKSLFENRAGDIIFSFLCRTTKRHLTFYDGTNSCLPGVCHVSMAEPFCAKTREVLLDVAKKLGIKCHSKGTVITVEGPRFSSRAESLMFRSCGADVINMTTVPEVILAKEAGICYASIAMATDYDCWKEHEETVSVDRVLKTLKENANKATSLLLTAIPQIGSMEWSETHQNLKKYSLTLPRVITFEP
uniref:Methylthioadenosine phosphorylase n=1 Tax=Pseudonaja textilis TaxID=8673 RepID=A0A670ZVP5_PSETE